MITNITVLSDDNKPCNSFMITKKYSDFICFRLIQVKTDTYVFWRLEIGFVEQDVSLSFIPDQQTQYSPIIEHILNPEKQYNQHIQYSVAIEQQEGILVECQLPTYRHYGRHSEQFRTCPRGDEDRGYKGSVQGPLPCEQTECQTGWHDWKHYLPTTSLVRAKYTTIF